MVGVATALLGAWIFTALYLAAGDRHEVVAVARDVGRFEVIERTDLRVVRISEEPGVEMVSADRVSELVGRVAGVDLLAGSLLSDEQIVAEGTEILAEDEAIVGFVLAPGDGPGGALRRGAPVSVVLRPLPGEDGELREVEGWVHGWSDEQTSGERSVELVVPRDSAAEVSAGAADGRVTLVVLAE